MLSSKHRHIEFSAGIWLALAALPVASGCMDRKLKPINPCLVSSVSERISVNGVDKVDLLFAVDNSGSMADEQAKLQRELPNLVETLTSGVRANGATFAAANDLHLGVITTDLGVPGVVGQLTPGLNCVGVGGDGRLQNMCPGFTIPNNQSFLTYKVEPGANASPQQIADQFGCLAVVGPDGCGYEMQLEAILKSVWPAPGFDIDPSTGGPLAATPVRFLTVPETPQGAYGHGGPAGAPTANAGFLRNDPAEGVSLLAVVLVTDEDDCSSTTTAQFEPGLDDQPLLRCFNYKQYLQPIQRYVEGLKALRRGNEELAIFAAIAGVPPELVSAQAYDQVDLADENARNAFYDNILANAQMQERPTGTNLALQAAELEPACSTLRGGNATPARRILDVVRGFGENGILQSICQDSFEGALNQIIEIIAARLGDVCLPRQLPRGSDGTVHCRVVWELPLVSTPVPGGKAPTSCDAFPYLSVAQDRPLTDTGRARCEVQQLATRNSAVQGADEGWYYDDFTPNAQQCPGATKQRVTFTAGAEPSNGVTVQLECLNETQTAPNVQIDLDRNYYTRRGEAPPTIGMPCDDGDRQCAVVTRGGRGDTMFCHREQGVCVQACKFDSDCPPAWVCDPREEQAERAGGQGQPRRICVNPTCGTF